MARPRRQSGYRSFAVVHEDDHLLVVTKPGGLLTTMAESGEQTLQDQVRRHSVQSPGDDAVSPTAAHRLDRFTSGLVIFGRTERALSGLGELMQSGGVYKTYWVLTVGVPDPEQGTIEAPLERIDHPRRKMQVSDAEHAQAARTDYRLKERIGSFALVESVIHTGRTHQLRVHFEHLGTPIAGDNIYGNKKASAELRRQHGLQRQFIHARQLEFKHPVTGASIKLTAKLPKDLSRVLKSLRQSNG